jgi:hypothetical protein
MKASTAVRLLVMVVLGPGSAGVLWAGGAEHPVQGPAYKVVAVCPLVSLAEVKKLAPWAPHIDPFAKAEEEALGSTGSSCSYPTAHVQVMAFNQRMLDAARKSGTLEPVQGVGDEAWVRNNRNLFAELYARVGPHLLTVQTDISTNETFDSEKPTLIALAKAFVARLR